jgi:predicted amidophosphoribosyltransferase
LASCVRWAAAAVRASVGSACELLFPRRCFSCSGSLPVSPRLLPLCEDCERELVGPHGPVCYACGGDGTLSAAVASGRRCSEPGHEHFKVFAGFLMRGPGADLVHALKYSRAKVVAPFVAARMLSAWSLAWESRERERGFNQSRLLAEELTRATGVLTAPDLLRRARATAAQAGLRRESRGANVSGAFAAPFPSALRGRRIVLIDDVVTTGATLGACVEVLHGCGAAGAVAVAGALS